jgi:ferredoxin
MPALKADLEVCQGYANCVEVAPDDFDVSDEGKVIVVREDFSDEERPLFEEAVRSCPMNALRIAGA